MGCCTSRVQSKDANEQLLIEAEEKLEYFHVKSLDIDRVSHRNSVDWKMRESQLRTVCGILKLNYEDQSVKEFYSQFCIENIKMYCVRRLALLGILLGVGEIREKICLLFQNYDVDASNSLEHREIDQMLSDITIIAFSYIPCYAMKLYQDDRKQKIFEYQKSLMSIRTTVIKHFKNLIFEERGEKITFPEFQKLFRNTKIQTLLSTSSIRKFSKGILDNVFRTAEAIKSMIENPDSDATEKLKILEREDASKLLRGKSQVKSKNLST